MASQKSLAMRIFLMNSSEKPSIVSLLQEKDLARSLLRLIGFGIALSFLSLLFGIAFMLIFFGAFWCIFRLAPFWKPAYRLTAKIVRGQENAVDFKPLRLPWWQLFPWVLHIGVGLFLIGFGLWILIHNGFNQQNLIYLVLKSK
jgi:hypothetical protein